MFHLKNSFAFDKDSMGNIHTILNLTCIMLLKESILKNDVIFRVKTVILKQFVKRSLKIQASFNVLNL
jgi:hypothetical protein